RLSGRGKGGGRLRLTRGEAAGGHCRHGCPTSRPRGAAVLFAIALAKVRQSSGWADIGQRFCLRKANSARRNESRQAAGAPLIPLLRRPASYSRFPPITEGPALVSTRSSAG